MTYWGHVAELRSGDDGTGDTLRAMVVLARQAAAVAPYGGRLWADVDPDERARMIRGFLAHHVRYQEDPPDAELVRHPLAMLDQIRREGHAVGDCDDVATLGAALALAAGLRARFRVVAFDAEGAYTHVWTEVSGRGGEDGWLELDTTRPAALPEALIIRRTAIVEV